MTRALAWTLSFALLACAVFFGRFLLGHDWEWGRQRSLLVLLLGAAAFFARSPAGRLRLRAGPILVPLWALALWLTGATLVSGAKSVIHSARTGEIKLDQGQNTLRAARLLRRGESPYARWQLLDLEAYYTRGRQRDAAGLGTPGLDVRAALGRFWTLLDPADRRALLPPTETKAARAEGALYGYKYGPLLPLVTAPADALFGPGAVMGLQLVLYAAWILLLALGLRATGVEPGAVPLALIALALEPTAAANFLDASASDVWVLAASAGAVLAYLRQRPVALGLCTAAALACKVFPAVLLLPFLLVRPRRAGLLALALGLAMLFGPFALWDAGGLFANLVLWPSQMGADNTGWSWYVAPALQTAARALLLSLLVALSGWFVRSQRAAAAQAEAPYGFLALGGALSICAGAAFHNNYAAWVTAPAICAAVAAFLGGASSESGEASGPESASAQQPSASTNR